MNMISILTRALILAVFGLGISITMMNRVQPVNAASLAKTQPTRAIAQSDVVELPTISVRPTAQDLADAENTDEPIATTGRSSRSMSRPQFIHAVTPTLPTLGLDMPYYSFGKALPRVTKE